MATNDPSVTFKVFNQQFNDGIKEMNDEGKKLRQELKLEQEQMVLTGTESEKLGSVLQSLQKQYEVAQQKTAATAEQLEAVKQQFGDNSVEAGKMESALRRAQISEQQLANQISQTSEKLAAAKEAEAQRTSAETQAKQKLSELADAEKLSQSASDGLTKQYELERAQLAKNATDTDKAKLEYTYLQAAQKQAAQTTANLRQQLEQAKTAYSEDSQQVQDLKNKLLDAEKAEQDLANRSDEVGKKVSTSFRQFASSASDAGNKLKEVGSKVSDVGKDATMKISTPIVGAFALSAKAGTEFETELADIRKELNNGSMTAGQLDKIMAGVSANSLKWSQQYGVSTTTINEGILELVKNGYNVQESQQIMRGSVEASMGANEDLNDVLNASTSVLETYGLKTENTAQNIKNATRVQNIMAAVANATKASFTSLGEGFSVVGATAKSLNQPITVTASAIGELESNGVDASTAATALKSGLVNLTKPTAAGAAAMKSMGLNVFDAQGKMRPLPQILAQMERGTQGWTDKQKAAALATIFGKDSLASWNILMNQGSKHLQDLTNEADNSNGAVKRMADQMRNAPANKFKELQQSAHALAISFSQEVLPAVMPIVNQLTRLVQWFGQLNPAIKQTIVVILAIVAAIGPLIMMIGSLITFVGTVISFLGFIMPALSTVGTAIMGLVGLLSGPVLLIIGVVIAAVVAVIAIIKNWGTIVGWLQGIWNAFSGWIGALWQGISIVAQTVWNGLASFFSTVWSGIVLAAQIIWQGLVFVFQAIWAVISAVFISAWSLISAPLILAWNLFVAGAQLIWGPLATFFTGLWNGIRSVAVSVWQAISGLVIGVWNGIKAVALPIWNATSGVLTNVWNSIRGVASSVWNGIKAVISAVWNSIKSSVSADVRRVESVVSAVWNAIRGVTSSVWNGIRSVVSGVWSGIHSSVSSAVHAVESIVSSVWGSIRSATSSAWNAVKDAIMGPIDSAKSLISKAIHAIESFFSGMHLSLPHINLPHFTISGKFSLNPPSIPSIGVNWYANGGIFDQASVIGIGEAGKEAAMPLEGSAMVPFADAVANRMLANLPKMAQSMLATQVTNNNQIVFNNTVRNDKDIGKIADQVNQVLNTRYQGKAAAFGGGAT